MTLLNAILPAKPKTQRNTHTWSRIRNDDDDDEDEEWRQKGTTTCMVYMILLDSLFVETVGLTEIQPDAALYFERSNEHINRLYVFVPTISIFLTI